MDKALTKQGLSTKAVEKWKAEMPTEQEMMPKDKYTIFDRKEKGYRKGIHSTFDLALTSDWVGKTWSLTPRDEQNYPSGRGSVRGLTRRVTEVETGMRDGLEMGWMTTTAAWRCRWGSQAWMTCTGSGSMLGGLYIG